MKRQIILATFVLTAAASVVTIAGIPEPDTIIFGLACISGASATDQDDVTIIARANVNGEIREVGRYKMGDHPGASNCDGDNDCYVLRIRMESVLVGTTPSDQAVILIPNNTSNVQLFVKQGLQAEVPAGDIVITGRAMTVKLNIRNGTVSVDINSDGQKNLADYQLFKISFLGPNVPSSTACNPSDINGDGFVDLRDAALIQLELTP